MSITGELRTSGVYEYAAGNRHFTEKELTAIADRVDAKNEETLREAYNKGCEDGMGVANAKDAQAEYLRGKNDGYDEGWDAGFASADDWLGQHEDEMAKHGWVRLPKDADGEPIHVGDEVEEIDCDGGHRVFELRMCESGWWVTADGICRRPYKYRHYNAPTVEDVLTEFAAKLIERSGLTNGAAQTIAEYAKRLTLAEEEHA